FRQFGRVAASYVLSNPGACGGTVITHFAEDLGRGLAIIKRNCTGVQDLDLLVSLACDQHDIPRPRFFERQADRAAPLRLSLETRARALQANHRVIDDSQ